MADLTIKFKGNPIVEMSESGTKTLATGGKYCEDDITVEYVKPAGGDHTYQVGHDGSVLKVNTDMFETRAVEHILNKYYYNGVLLPEIPADVLAEFPHCWINSADNGLVVAAYPWYYASGKMNIPTTAENRKYILHGDYWVLDKTYTDTGGYSVDSLPTWSSHDIPNGSATATEIYFAGSEPVPVEETT